MGRFLTGLTGLGRIYGIGEEISSADASEGCSDLSNPGKWVLEPKTTVLGAKMGSKWSIWTVRTTPRESGDANGGLKGEKRSFWAGSTGETGSGGVFRVGNGNLHDKVGAIEKGSVL